MKANSSKKKHGFVRVDFDSAVIDAEELTFASKRATDYIAKTRKKFFSAAINCIKGVDGSGGVMAGALSKRVVKSGGVVVSFKLAKNTNLRFGRVDHRRLAPPTTVTSQPLKSKPLPLIEEHHGKYSKKPA